MRQSDHPSRMEWACLLIILAIAAGLRFYAIGSLPPGLYRDEAYNGLDALRVLAGERPIYFPANNGREPLFIYLVAVSVALFGRSPGAIRLVAAILGTGTIPVIYLWARQALNARIALLSAAITALSFWHVNLSRIGFRVIAMPLLVTASLWLLWRGVRARRHLDIMLAGTMYGLAFYTYLATRFTVIALAVFIAYLVFSRRSLLRHDLVYFLIPATVMLVPLGLYAWGHPEIILGRTDQVSIFNPAINHGDLWGTLALNLARTLAMFTTRGDFIPRHNLPYRPVFDLLMATAFLVGVIVALRGRRLGHRFTFIWVAAMLLPTILAEGAPHFLRAAGILPFVFVIPALGLDAIATWMEGRGWQMLAIVALVAIVAVSGLWTVRDYFLAYAPSETVYYHFETGATELAACINQMTGVGWIGPGFRMSAVSDSASAGAVYLQARLWRDWPSVRFLVPVSPRFTLLWDEAPIPTPSVTPRTLLVVWPYENYKAFLRVLPNNAVICAREDTYERGDLESEPRLLYLAYETTDASQVPRNLDVRFEQGITLLGCEQISGPEGVLHLTLYWKAEHPMSVDYTVFVHALSGGAMLTQDDAPPARGYYPTTMWRPGDIVCDEHRLHLDSATAVELRVGLYRLENMSRLRTLDAEGQPSGDSVVIPVPTM
ncbi:MAG: glycosyltransferase family 39 protein [Chloroflexi bacterium]|nr:glycosyltransferase family 39 protein [Chloroflexota bacterium]